MKKSLALILTFIMVLALVPSVAFALNNVIGTDVKTEDIGEYCKVDYRTRKIAWHEVTVEVYVNYQHKMTKKIPDRVSSTLPNFEITPKQGYYYNQASPSIGYKYESSGATYDGHSLGFNKKEATVKVYLFTFENGANVDFTRVVLFDNLNNACDTLTLRYTHGGQDYEFNYTNWNRHVYVPKATYISVEPHLKNDYKLRLWMTADAYGDGANKVLTLRDGDPKNRASENLKEEGKTMNLPFIGEVETPVRAGSYTGSTNMAFYVDSGYKDLVIFMHMNKDDSGEEPQKYTHKLIYDANGGDGGPQDESSEETANTSHTFTVSNTVPIRVNYTFLGWADTADATVEKYKAGDKIIVSGIKTIYAVWKSSINPPTYEELKGLVGKVAVNCIIGTEHGKKEYDLIEGSYISGTIGTDGDGNYTYSITINPESYVATYEETNGDHTLDPADQEKTVSFTRGKEDTGWKVVENQTTVPVVFTVKHATTVPGSVSAVTKTRLKEVPEGVSLPENVTINEEETVIFTDNNTSATLLYAFTVTGTPSAKVVIKDTDATFIGNGQTVNGEITVTLPAAGENEAEITVYGYRTFSVDDIQNGKLVNNATANVEGDDKTKHDEEKVDAKDNRTLNNTLTVKKLVSGNAANMTEKFTFKATFTFPVPGASANPDGVTSGESVEIDFELAHNQTKTFSYTSDPELKTKIDELLYNGTVVGTGDNVFAMLSYKVEETDTKGYTLATNGDAEGKAEGHNTVTFTNTKNKPNDDHGGHYHPTTTPVPVIVIPPKTGDMTVWQSILHFLGIR